MDINALVFVGFNKQVGALDRQTGEIIWKWAAPDGSGFVSLLLDGDRLIAAVQGYTYCLDPRTGAQLWQNNMKGFGYGITSIVSARGASSQEQPGAVQAQHAQTTAATSAATSSTV